jgi:hypothetical protein
MRVYCVSILKIKGTFQNKIHTNIALMSGGAEIILEITQGLHVENIPFIFMYHVFHLSDTSDILKKLSS